MRSTAPMPVIRCLAAGALYFALVFGTGFVLGTIRIPFLVPRLGVRVAELLEMPFMLVAIMLAARIVARRSDLPETTPVRLFVGLVALAFLVLAELALAAMLQNESVGDYVASRDPVSGSVYIAMLILFALMPLILARVRRRRATGTGVAGLGARRSATEK